MIWHDLTREPIRQQPKVDQEEDLLLERPITKLGWKFHFSLENRFEATSERTFDLSSFEGISSWLSSEGKDSFPDCRFSPWVNFLMVWPLVANFLAPFSRGGLLRLWSFPEPVRGRQDERSIFRRFLRKNYSTNYSYLKHVSFCPRFWDTQLG